ncbi:hypothetical protein [Riemerella anatipestifer]|uniref:Uncharacterized protein n=1 Tax=Riemerella anatipestifer TaxID=34085 RepID=A0AAP6LLU6_RIEAN|nr:hypothetical protein [Riemerella anatipestifer]MCO7355867.1 hypothetical protein [Riemerella anatipestifer]MCU7540381.1 hypothetical protein [Riemerella anatipestifer]MCU7571587.1 hypothetical protein [Riemerella anatipestifer]MCU7598737.1 hypothetical protein [Riemerella anatipestifer]MCW0495562.1 hypothetical protein [Riemerella anatipestifer]
MRSFSKFEKDIIEAIVKINTKNANVLTFITNCILENRGVKIDDSNKEISLWYLKTDTKAVSEFFETIALLNYLEKSDLIFIHSNPGQELGSKNFASKNIDQKYLDTNKDNLVDQPIPTNIYEHIERYARSYLFVGTELYNLVENKFVTLDEIRHQREIKIARWSLIVAFIALFFSFLSPFIFNTDIKIKQEQIDSVRTDLRKISNSIDSLNLEIIKEHETEKKESTKNTSR